MARKTWLTGIAASALVVSSLTALPQQAHADDRNLGRMSDYIEVGAHNTTGDIVKDRWLVRVAGQPILGGGTQAQVTKAQNAVLQAAQARGLKIKGHRSYSRTFNGLAVSLSAKQATLLAQVPGVTGIYPVAAISQPADKGAKPDMASAVNLSGVAVARDDLGYNGQGIKVGVIDSGIDIDHPDLGGNGTNGSTPFPTKRVKWGYDFVGDAYDARDDKSVPVPDAVPDDCGGHGTHVAGIIGADGDTSKGGIKGVAPKVSFGAYRVFGCQGSASTEVILAAMDRAAADGMDVVNMSLGDSMMTWPDYPTAQAADALSAKGIVMVNSAGNDGTSGVFTGGAPGVARDSISVASFDNTHVTAYAFTVDGKKFGYDSAEGAPMAPRSGSLKLAVAGAPGTAAGQGCDPYTTKFAPGTAVLVQRGTCSFRQKALNAQAAGAAAVVLYNNAPGTISPTVEGDPAITIPVVMISKADGEALAASAAAGDKTLTWTNDTVTTADPRGGQVSDFSSWGVAADLTLKPDLGAPGGNIWSTYPLEKGGHTSMSGTSMASPHVAGSVALLLQARPELKGHPHQVRELLQNTAKHDALWSLNPQLGLQEPVARQGAGMIQVDRAILTKQSIYPSKISLGDDQSRAHTTVLTLRNDGAKKVVYNLSNQTSIGTLGTSDPQFDLLDAQVDMPSKVVVPPHGSKKVKVTITAPADADNGYLYGGWIQASSITGTSLSVPYLGMAGDYQRVSVLTAPGSDAPCLGEMTGTAPNQTPKCLADQTGQSYSMAEGNRPVAVFRVEYPVETLKIDVYRAAADGSKGQLLGTALQVEHDGRELGDLGFTWDGTYQTTGANSYKARVAAGKYLLEVKALRPLGKASVAADWETWTSPAFEARFDAPATGAATDTAKLDGSVAPVNG